MNIKRVIPCLDIKDGRLVKGVNFKNIKDVGDPMKAAMYYRDAGADEIVLLDVAATLDNRDILLDLIGQMAKKIDIPLIVGGGIGSTEDVEKVLTAGADKVSINSGAIVNPGLIDEISSKFSREQIVVAIDAKIKNNKTGWDVYTAGGRKNTGIDVLIWAQKMERLGAGELLLTSMDRDGTKAGYDIELIKAVKSVVSIPIIASGGAGRYEDFYDVIVDAGADAVLAASLFHYREIDIKRLKEYLDDRNIPVY